MKIVIEVDLEKSPIVKYAKRIFATITRRKKISELEEKIRAAYEENQMLKTNLITYEKEASAALELAIEEENKRKEIERKLQKEIINLQEKLEKVCTNHHIKEIIKRNNREIETLASFIPLERTQEPVLKLSHVHPREAKYIEFLNSLKRIPYVIAIIDKEAKEAKYSRISRIELEEILLIYVHNSCGYRVTVKTTAQTMAQQYYISELIKKTFDFH